LTQQRILITGASGCVGQYISSWLLRNSEAELLLWIREPKKITAIDHKHPRIKLLVGDIRDPSKFTKELSTVNRVIHTATAWGDQKRANEVNIKAVKDLLEILDSTILEQFIYFSTASILTRDLKPLPEALIYGTEYIQTKAICFQQLKDHKLAEKIIVVFPTLVFGGRIDGISSYPTSYLTAGLSEAANWIWLARWFKAYSRFHFIHAEDIAFVCGHLATSKIQGNINKNHIKEPMQIVLGQPSLTIDQAIDNLLLWRGMRRVPKLPLWGWLVRALIKFLPVSVNSWDLFSIKKRHFDHNPISNPETFGGISHAKTLKDVLRTSGLPHS